MRAYGCHLRENARLSLYFARQWTWKAALKKFISGLDKIESLSHRQGLAGLPFLASILRGADRCSLSALPEAQIKPCQDAAASGAGSRQTRKNQGRSAPQPRAQARLRE
jgi:hypothetical protein